MMAARRFIICLCLLQDGSAFRSTVGAAPTLRPLRAVRQITLRPLSRLADFIFAPLVHTLMSRDFRRRRLARRPRRIILVRHGESVGNADKTLYMHVADPSMGLTEVGFMQGRESGAAVREIVGDETCRFYHSPYVRTRQSMLSMLKEFPPDRPVLVTVEPRLREQDFGNFQDPAEMRRVMRDRQRYGRFFYRIPNGESGSDVYDRVADFWSCLLRSMDDDCDVDGWGGCNRAQNVVLVTHGLLMRLFCMSYFKWTVAEFEQVWNPANGEIWVLERPEGALKYRLAGRYVLGERQAPGEASGELAERPRGRFEDVRFGVNMSQPMYAHMKAPLQCRVFKPGESLDGRDDLAHLQGQLDRSAWPVAADLHASKVAAWSRASGSRCE